MTEWIVCEGAHKNDPRAAKAVSIACVSDAVAGFQKFNNYLLKDVNNKYAFKRESYERWFKDRVNLDTLPKINYGGNGNA
jgi:hypothetical protein